MSSGDDNSNGTDRRNVRRRAVRPSIIEGEARELPAAEGQAEETPRDAAATDAETVATEVTAEAETGASAEAVVDAPQTEAAEASDEATPEETSATDEPSSEDESAGETGAEEAEPAEPDAEGPITEEPVAEAPAAEPVPLPTARRASVIAAGLVGAIIALGGYFGLYYGGVLPNDRNAIVDTVSSDVEDLDRRVAIVKSNLGRVARRDNSKELTERITEVEDAVKELGADPKNALVRRVADAEAKIEKLGQDLEGAPTVTEIDARLTAMENKLAELGSATATGAGEAAGDVAARLSDIEKRIEAVEARPAVVTPDGKPVDDAAMKVLTDRIDALNKQMQETTATVAELSKTGAAEDAAGLKDVDAALASLRSDLDKLNGSLAGVTSDVGARLDAFEKSMASRDTQELRGMARTTAGALAVAALQKAADSGSPFANELAALTPLVDKKADLGVLKSHAATGVPKLATLQAGFAATTNAIMTAGTPGKDQGVISSLLSSARSLVHIRPTGKVDGSGRGAVVARIEAALKTGDLKTAETEWSSLDDAAKAVSQSWADDLKARIAVDAALADLSSSLTASLAGTTAKD